MFSAFNKTYAARMLPDLFFPPRCPGCGEILGLMKRIPYYQGAPEELCFLHRTCLEKFQEISENCCKKCGTPMKHAGRLCPRCQEGPRAFEACRSLVVYEGAAREAMLQIKYHSRLEYCDYFAFLTQKKLGSWITGKNICCIIPVPVHKKKRKMRGYNQAMELAKRIGCLLGIPVREDLLIRTKNTVAQKELSPEERSMNLMNAFDIDQKGGSLPEGCSVLLIDDIYTTGATMDACAWVLRRKAGAGKVYAASMCAASMAEAEPS